MKNIIPYLIGVPLLILVFISCNKEDEIDSSALTNTNYTKVIKSVTVSTLAGQFRSGYVNGYGTNARFGSIRKIALDQNGNIIVPDFGFDVIRKVSPDRYVTTLAGSGIQGFADGRDSIAQFDRVMGVAVDKENNIYLADTFNNRIRKVTPSGMVTTLAGDGSFGITDGEGSIASFGRPTDVVIDKSGNVYVADERNNKIRKITPEGIVSTFAGSGVEGFADGKGENAQFSHPEGLAIDLLGNLYLADDENDRIRKITPQGDVTTLAGNGIRGFADGADTVAQFSSPYDIAVDALGYVYVADSQNHKIRMVSPNGDVTTLAGIINGNADGDASVAKFNTPFGVAVNPEGTQVFVADELNGKIRNIDIEYTLEVDIASTTTNN